MKILIASATATELGTIATFGQNIGMAQRVDLCQRHSVQTLITGVGVAATTFSLARNASNFDLVLSVGIAGSYNPCRPIAEVVRVTSDCFADYGIDDNGTFTPLHKAELCANPDIMQNISFQIDNIINVKGITVGTASGSTESIRKNIERWNPDIETMENAAVFYVCNLLNIPFVCLRAISNKVEPRNKNSWQIMPAICALQQRAIEIVNSIE